MSRRKTAVTRARRLLRKLASAKHDRVDAPTHIYLAAVGDRAKIGVTAHPAARLRQVETAAGVVFDVMSVWQARDARKVEARALAALGEFRQPGEWPAGSGVYDRAADVVIKILGEGENGAGVP